MNKNPTRLIARNDRMISRLLTAIGLTAIGATSVYAQPSKPGITSPIISTTNAVSSSSMYETTLAAQRPVTQTSRSPEDALNSLIQSFPSDCPANYTGAWYREIFGFGSAPRCQIDQNNLGPISAIWMAQDALKLRRDFDRDHCAELNGISEFSAKIALPGEGRCTSSAPDYMQRYQEIQISKCCIPRDRVFDQNSQQPVALATRCEQMSSNLETLPGTGRLESRGMGPSCTIARTVTESDFDARVISAQSFCAEQGGEPILINPYLSSRCMRLMPNVYEQVMTVQILCCRSRPSPARPSPEGLTQSIIENRHEDEASQVESGI